MVTLFSFRRLSLALALGGLAACATSAPEGALIADPYEETNREFFEFNKGMDQVLLRPVAYIYKEATPALTQHLVGNAVQHLRLPGVFINNLLQGELMQAGRTLGRFAANTIMGAGGLLDPATELGLGFEPTDFGVTLAKAGVSEGPYFMTPLLGPKTGRHLAGDVVDLFLDPVGYLDIPTGARVARIVAPPVVARAGAFEAVDETLYETPDPYIATRSIYVQRRRALVAGDAAGVDAAPDIYAGE